MRGNRQKQGRTRVLHDGADVGEVEVDQTRNGNEIGNSLNTLTQRIVGDAECIEHAGLLFHNLEQTIVRDNDEGVYLLREIVDTLLCLIAAKTTLKAEGLGDDANGKGTDFLASDFCNYRSCTGTSAAAFTCGNENHVGIGKSFANLGTGFLCCLTANLGVGTCTQTTGNFFADMDSLISIGRRA